MCLVLRKIVNLGRSGVPEIFLRIRAFRLIRASIFELVELMAIPVNCDLFLKIQAQSLKDNPIDISLGFQNYFVPVFPALR